MAEDKKVEDLNETQLDEKLSKERKVAEIYKIQLEILKVKVQIAEMKEKLKENDS